LVLNSTAAYGDISLVKIQLQISTIIILLVQIQLLISRIIILTSENVNVDIKN